MIPLWNLARLLRAPELAIDSTSQADCGPVTLTTEDLMTVDDRNRRSGQHDK